MGVENTYLFDPQTADAISDKGHKIMNKALLTAAMETYDVCEATALLYKNKHGCYPPTFEKWDSTTRELKILERTAKIKKIRDKYV